MSQRDRVTVGCLLIALCAAPVVAGQSVFRADAGALPDVLREDCQIGNTAFDEYQGYYTDFWQAGIALATLIEPDAQGCVCAEGITVSEISTYLAVNQFSVIHMQVELWSAMDDGSGCLVPDGPLDIGSPAVYGSFPGEVVVQLGVSLSSPCITADDPYFIVVRYLDISMSAFTGIPVDSSPDACSSYVDWPGIAGWHDVVTEYGWVGNFYVFAAADCCSEPVANEAATWSTIKKTFR